LWPRLKKEKIESISLCDGDLETDVDSWLVFGEVPKEHLEKIKELFGDELEQRFGMEAKRYSIYSCQEGMLKIVTDKGKYAVPAFDRGPQNNWREYVTLVGLWPHLQNEKIISISFCEEIMGLDIDSGYNWNVPKEKLDECIKLIDKAMRDADRHFVWGPYWEGRMKIITDKRKYLVPADTDICKTNNPKVYGNGWTSFELGEFLKKSGFCNSDSNQPSQKPSE
jgi:hypothetical protein